MNCTDDNPVVRCQDVQWRVQSGTNSTEWKSSTKSTTPNLFVASINLVGPDELKHIVFRSFDGVGNIFDGPNNLSVTLLLDTAPPGIFIAPMFVIVENDQNNNKVDGIAKASKNLALSVTISDTTPVTLRCTFQGSNRNRHVALDTFPMHSNNKTIFVSTEFFKDAERCVVQCNATDAVGYSNSGEFHWINDGEPPLVQIIPPEQLSVPATKSKSGTFTVQVTDATSGVNDTFCTVDGTPINCNGATVNVEDGAHVFQVTAGDLVGNIAPTRSHGWITDTTPPKVQMGDLVPVDDALSITIHGTCIDELTSCHLEYDVQLASSDDSDQNTGCAPDPIWKEINMSNTIDVPVSRFGTFTVYTRGVDNCTNPSKPISRRIVIKTKSRPPPTSLQRQATSGRNLTMSWTDVPFTTVETASGPAIASFSLQWSSSPTFPEDVASVKEATTIHFIETNSYHMNVDIDLFQSLVIARVQRSGANTWSLPSSIWTLASECSDNEYLDTLSNQNDPTNWTCTTCPRGAFCKGDITWSRVTGMFGYWRVPGPAPQFFERCIFAGACLGSPNKELENQFFLNGSDLAAVSEALVQETCNEKWGHNNDCGKDGRCRLCNSCLANFKAGHQRGRCDACPTDSGTNVALIILGVAVAIAGASAIIAMTIHAGGGVVEVSEACKKILINYLQVVSLAAVFPVRWPVAVESFFAFQSTISSISKTLLSPDCELSHGKYFGRVFFVLILKD